MVHLKITQLKRNIIFHSPPFLGVPVVNFPGCSWGGRRVSNESMGLSHLDTIHHPKTQRNPCCISRIRNTTKSPQKLHSKANAFQWEFALIFTFLFQCQSAIVPLQTGNWMFYFFLGGGVHELLVGSGMSDQWCLYHLSCDTNMYTNNAFWDLYKPNCNMEWDDKNHLFFKNFVMFQDVILGLKTFHFQGCCFFGMFWNLTE